MTTERTTHRLPEVGARALIVLAALVALLAAVIGTPAPASAGTVTSGQLDWGVKESFRTYIVSSIASGTITTAGGASVNGNGTFRFPTASGGTRDSATAVVAPVAGSVHFYGHEGILDLTLSDIVVTISGSTGTVRADMDSADAESHAIVHSEDITFATLTPDPGSVSGLTTTWTNVPVVLSAAGAPGFGGFYQPGDEIDPLTLSVTEAAPTTTSTAAPGTTSSTAGGGSSTSSTSSSTSSSVVTTTSSSSTSSSSTSSSTTSTTLAPSEATVVGGHVDWGVKQSFRTYITGPIAHGSATTDGGATTNGDGTYRFPVADGATYAGADDVDAPTDGALHFTGHDGELDLDLTQLEVVIDGTDASLFADLSSLALEETEPTVYDDIELATLDLSAVSPTTSGSELTYAAIPATLAEEGAEAFAGFYEAGAALDPLTLVLDLEGNAGPLPTTPTTPPAVSLGSSTVGEGGSVTASGAGFLPGEQVQVWVHSTPTFAAITTADATGAVSTTFALPAGITAGTHRVELRGLSSGRSIFSGDLTVTATGGGLPRTGAEQQVLLVLALVLLLSGGALQLSAAARDRRRLAG